MVSLKFHNAKFRLIPLTDFPICLFITPILIFQAFGISEDLVFFVHVQVAIPLSIEAKPRNIH